jgi:hypothetical protein
MEELAFITVAIKDVGFDDPILSQVYDHITPFKKENIYKQEAARRKRPRTGYI